MVVFSGNLLRNGEQVGRIGVVCTFVSTANADELWSRPVDELLA
jgi:hypothetical protein